MKKWCCLLLIFILALSLTGCNLGGISYLYAEYGEIDGFYVAVNPTAKCCFVGAYTCTEYTDKQEITIPDEYNGFPITRVGGYYGRGVPTPFEIPLNELHIHTTDGDEHHIVFNGPTYDLASVPNNATITELVFRLHIGKNINTIEYVAMDVYTNTDKNGNTTYYRPVVYITCAEDNPHFYSKDGKLYDKKADEVVTAFAYPSI